MTAFNNIIQDIDFNISFKSLLIPKSELTWQAPYYNETVKDFFPRNFSFAVRSQLGNKD